MKKVFGLVVGMLGVCSLFMVGAQAQAADCLNVKFDSGDNICIALEKSGSRYYASLEKNNTSSNASLRCEILLPDDTLENLGACNGYFQYSSSSTEKVRLYIRYKNSEYKVIDANYNFKNSTWGSSSSGGGSSSSSDDIEISTNKSSPSTDQWVNVTVETDSSYRGEVEFYLQYRSSSSSSWSNVTSSSYFTADDEFDDGYKFTSSDKGEVTFNSFIKFKKSGYYRLYVEDDDGNEDYIQFNVDTSSSSSDDIEISTNKSSPSTDQWVNVTVETDSSYRGEVEFYLQYRSSSSSSWSNVTSSSYFTADDEFDDGYKFTSSDKGEVTFNSFIKFKKSGYYRLYVEDDDGNEDYIQFDVDSSSSSSDDIEISASRTSPSTDQWVNITVETDSSYRGEVEFYLQYRSSSSSSWSNVTSSSYFTADDEFDDGYKFTSSDKGEVTFNSFIKFKKSGYYRLYVEDDDGNEDYIQFDVDSSSSSSDDIEISTNNKSPDKNAWVNLTVETDSSYRGKVEFTVKYKDGSSWKTTTSSSYYEVSDDYSSDFKNGYTMGSSDKGEVTFKKIIRFKKEVQYRIYVEDKDGNENYIAFNVGDGDDDGDSDVDGFTNSEYKKIKNVSNIWNDVIAQLKRNSSSLRNDSYRQRLTDSLYDNMRDVVNDKNNRTFEDWDDFMDAFNTWYKYTVRNS